MTLEERIAEQAGLLPPAPPDLMAVLKCERHHRYPSERAALTASVYHDERSCQRCRRGFPFEVFACDVCAGWHTGHNYRARQGG